MFHLQVPTVALWQSWVMTLENFPPHINGTNYAIESHFISHQKIIGTDNNKSSETAHLYIH